MAVATVDPVVLALVVVTAAVLLVMTTVELSFVPFVSMAGQMAQCSDGCMGGHHWMTGGVHLIVIQDRTCLKPWIGVVSCGDAWTVSDVTLAPHIQASTQTCKDDAEQLAEFCHVVVCRKLFASSFPWLNACSCTHAALQVVGHPLHDHA